MAEQGVVLDIDAKFLKNLENAEKALKAAVQQSDKLTSAFSKSLGGSSAVAQMMKQLQDSLQKIGGVNFSSGVAKLNTDVRSTADAVNLITLNVGKLKGEYASMVNSFGGRRNRGTHLRITSDEDLTNIAKLRNAIANINQTLGNKKRKTSLTLVEIESLNRQKDLYKRTLKELMLSDEQRTQKVIQEVNRRIKEANREAKAIQAGAYEKYTKSPASALSYAKSAKSINEMTQAIKYLETVRDRINSKTASGAKDISRINNMITQLNGNVSGLRGKVARIREGISNVNIAAEKWSNIMKGVLGIQAIRGYVNKLASVRGEFELQQRALQAILRNKRETNELWDQTVQLAVRSPFQVKELVTYTKQLAAYRVEAGKLNQTTNMLADISAGLGVDMGRLILAFGQVKAANYLRGTELRQFSEAGINILDELARYYTAMEGRAVTVSQVFDRVSKRMVSLADVEKVLQNVTGAGGMFYKMQEIQAETLKGSISNLKDQIDLMLNEIGEKNEGILKLGVGMIKALVENYEILVPVLSVVTASFVAMQLAILKTKIGGEALAAGMSKMKKVMLSPWTLALIAITEVAAAIVKYRHEIKQIEKDHRMMMDSLDAMSLAMKDAFAEDDIKNARKALSDLLTVAKNDFSIDLGLSEEDLAKIDLSTIKTKFEELQEDIRNANLLSTAIEEAFASYTGFMGLGTGFGSLFQKGAYESSGKMVPDAVTHSGDIKDRIDEYEQYASSLQRKLQSISSTVANYLNLGKDHPLRAVQEGTQSDLDYLNSLIAAWENLDKNAIVEHRPDLAKDVNEIEGLIQDSEFLSLQIMNQFGSFFGSQVSEMAYDWSDQAVIGALNGFVSGNKWSDFTRELIFKSIQVPFNTTNNQNNNNNKGLGGEGAGKDPRWENLLRTIKEMNSAFKELNKTFDETTAKEGMMAKYSDALNDVLSKVTINGEKLDAMSFVEIFDVSNEEGMKAALDLIAKEAPDAADKLKAKLEKGEIVWDAKIRLEEIKHKDLMGDMENLFSGYELSLELEKMNIPPSFAKNFFNLEAASLDELRSQIESRKGEFSGLNMESEYKELLEKLSAMEAKEQQERLKKYLGYARDAIGERAKIKLEEMRKLQEIELAFAPKVGESAEERTIRETAKASAIEGVRGESYQQTKKQEWEDFQKSDTFISIFQDLDMASETLINHALAKLQEFKDSWVDMPHEEIRSIVEKMNQLTSKLATIENPFKAFKETRKALEGVGSIDELQMSNVEQEAKISEYQKELELSERILALHQEGKAIEADELALAENRLEYFDLSADEAAKFVDEQKRGIQAAEDQIEKNNKGLSLYKKAKAQLLEQVEAVRKVQSVANDLYGAFKDLSEVLGDDNGTVALFMDIGNSIIDSVLNAVSLKAELFLATLEAEGFGAALNAAMGPIGWIVLAVQLISKVLGAVFAAHDNRLEKQIERISERVEVLQEQFEKLEEAMDRAFSLDQVSRYSEEAKKNMESQIQGYQQMIALEEDKKKTDHEKIKEWEEAMEEVQEQYDELMEEGFNLVTSDILSDVMGAARDFVDAWHDAFMETGDGLAGLEQNFTDMFKELMRQQAAMSIVGPYVERFKDQLKQFVDVEGGDTTLTTEEAREWAEKVKNTFPEISALLQSFFEGTQDLMQEQGELSELSKGIQGVTESTAQVLEALLNSMRFYVADSNMRLQNIEAAFASEEVSRNPILNELRQQTQMIRSIESMFDSVIGRGGSVHAGAYLKVSM